MLDFIFREHLRLALEAALLFGVGLLAAYPVVRCRLRAPAVVPLAALRFVMRLMGPFPSLVRMGGVIWAFNSVVMFIDMATGFHPPLPQVLALWTGLTVGIIAMGVSMGHAVPSGAAGYLSALSVRACAYLAVIVPILLASALAEAVAIRGAAAQDDG